MRRRPRWVAAGLLMPILLVGAAGAVVAGPPAKIDLTRQNGADGLTQITAVVTDADGEPVEGASVTFRMKTAFGWLTVADVESRSDGTAVVVLPPASLYAEIRADAGEGSVGVLATSAARPEPAVRPGRRILRTLSPQPGFISPYPPPQILFVALILGGIWTTYAYLVAVLMRIRRAGENEAGRPTAAARVIPPR